MVASKSVENKERIKAELAYARAARKQGKEGRARVCARRAAGWAIAAHYSSGRSRGALSQLHWLESNVKVSEALRLAAGRLTEQVTEDHDLPHSEDPLQDAEFIVAELLGASS